MRKYILFFVLLAFCVGCVSVRIPKYLNNKSPYTRKFYVNFEQALSLTERALSDLGWRIEEKADPAVYEQDAASSNTEKKRILLFTSVRQTPLFLGTRYAKMNIFLTAADDGTTDVEIRYLTVNSMVLRNIENYNNPFSANRLFDYIEKLMKEEKE